MKILVVDDEEILLSALCLMLSQLGYETCSASNGLEAITVLSKTDGIQLMITDRQMPEYDGIELTRYAKARNKTLRVCLLSGRLDEQLIMEAIRAGAEKVLQKPVEFSTLRRELNL